MKIIFFKVPHFPVLAWNSQGGQFPVWSCWVVHQNTQDGSWELESVQGNKVLLTQQGREAAWLGAGMELAGLWAVPSVPGANMKICIRPEDTDSQ